MGTWRTLHPKLILYAPVAISVHGSFRQASLEPGPSGQELRTLLTGQLRPRQLRTALCNLQTTIFAHLGRHNIFQIYFLI